MAAERFFNKVAQDVLDATERLANHLDDNFSLLFGRSGAGSSDHGDENDTGRAGRSSILDDIDGEDVLMDSPLQGMADQVLGGIMDGQVGSPVVSVIYVVIVITHFTFFFKLFICINDVQRSNHIHLWKAFMRSDRQSHGPNHSLLG
jgi:hypothetical protein